MRNYTGKNLTTEVIKRLEGIPGVGPKVAFAFVSYINAGRLGELMYTLMKKGTEYEVRHFKPGGKETAELVREALSA
jgi:Holliday junction resolvasome RuvABC DNA-binding subunit